MHFHYQIYVGNTIHYKPPRKAKPKRGKYRRRRPLARHPMLWIGTRRLRML